VSGRAEFFFGRCGGEERRGEWKKGEGEEVKVDGQFAAIGSKPFICGISWQHVADGVFARFFYRKPPTSYTTRSGTNSKSSGPFVL
jgi:hypothetical protein